MILESLNIVEQSLLMKVRDSTSTLTFSTEPQSHSHAAFYSHHQEDLVISIHRFNFYFFGSVHSETASEPWQFCLLCTIWHLNLDCSRMSSFEPPDILTHPTASLHPLASCSCCITFKTQMLVYKTKTRPAPTYFKALLTCFTTPHSLSSSRTIHWSHHLTAFTQPAPIRWTELPWLSDLRMLEPCKGF